MNKEYRKIERLVAQDPEDVEAQAELRRLANRLGLKEFNNIDYIMSYLEIDFLNAWGLQQDILHFKKSDNVHEFMERLSHYVDGGPETAELRSRDPELAVSSLSDVVFGLAIKRENLTPDPYLEEEWQYIYVPTVIFDFEDEEFRMDKPEDYYYEKYYKLKAELGLDDED